MKKEVDRRHGNYVPRDTVPIWSVPMPDTAPSEVEDHCIEPPPVTFRNEPIRANILADAMACTQGDRQAAYGSPAENWGRTAKIAQAITGLDCLTPEVCVKVAIAMKQARLIQTPGHRDSMVDLAGYAWVLSEVTAKTEAA